MKVTDDWDSSISDKYQEKYYKLLDKHKKLILKYKILLNQNLNMIKKN